MSESDQKPSNKMDGIPKSQKQLVTSKISSQKVCIVSYLSRLPRSHVGHGISVLTKSTTNELIFTSTVIVICGLIQ